MLKYYGDSYDLADTKNLFQILKSLQIFFLRVIRIRVIIFNDPDFSSVKCSLYRVKAGALSKKICDSDNIFLKSEVSNTGNGMRELYFTFKSPFGIRLLKDEYIAVLLDFSDYAPSTDSHVALVRAWPDPVYIESFEATSLNQQSAPYYLGVIGEKYGL